MAKKKSTKSKKGREARTGGGGFENKLREAADALRNNVDPADKLQEIIDTVIAQAEAMCKDWPEAA